MARIWIVTVIVLLVGCDLVRPKSGVGEVLGLKFGVPLNLKIKEGPRGPPAFYSALREFYEVEFPNMEFEFVGVAVTKNGEAGRKEGFEFLQENLIWGAYFSNNNKKCSEADFLRTTEYLAKNWNARIISDYRGTPDSGFNYHDSTFTSPNVIWNVLCSDSSQVLVVMDYAVLRKAASDNTKKKIDQMLSELNAAAQRKM